LKSLEFILDYYFILELTFRGSPNLYAVGHCRSDDLFVNEEFIIKRELRSQELSEVVEF